MILATQITDPHRNGLFVVTMAVFARQRRVVSAPPRGLARTEAGPERISYCVNRRTGFNGTGWPQYAGWFLMTNRRTILPSLTVK
jgi:hypothetical protein